LFYSGTHSARHAIGKKFRKNRKNRFYRFATGKTVFYGSGVDGLIVVGNPIVGFTRSEGGTDKTAELTEGMDGTRKFAW
jgi:hypothetical protein